MRFSSKNLRQLAAATLLTAILPGQVIAQSGTIERSLPLTPESGGGGIVLDNPLATASSDDTSLGVSVSGIALIGPDIPVPDGPTSGVSFRGIDEAYQAVARRALSPFIGKPLTYALISRARAESARVWREAGYPFMSVTVPPQEVTGGTLTLRIVEFVAGTVTSEDEALLGHIRQQTDAAISASRLSEDLDWLNRNPYREVSAVFAPGDQRGASDIALAVTRQKPFSIYAGWDNTGSEATGRGRWYAGGGAWIPTLNDTTAAWRYTRSNEIWSDDLFAIDPARPDYLSASGRIDFPTMPRQALSISPSFVISNEFLGQTPFSFENMTIEVPILYRTAISNVLPEHQWGEIFFGIEPKWLRRVTRFAGVDVANGEAGLVNIVLGWSHILTDAHGRTAIEFRVKANPGGIVAGNTAADWAAFTGGRITDHTYVHAGFDISRWTTLPGGLSLNSVVTGLIAGQSLPDTERLGLGGPNAVRGYATGDVPVDAGVIWRNELHLASWNPMPEARFDSVLSPFAFLDMGWGRDIGTQSNHSLMGTGLGLNYAIGNNFNAGASAALALKDAGSTKAGTVFLTANLRFTY